MIYYLVSVLCLSEGYLCHCPRFDKFCLNLVFVKRDIKKSDKTKKKVLN